MKQRRYGRAGLTATTSCRDVAGGTVRWGMVMMRRRPRQQRRQRRRGRWSEGDVIAVRIERLAGIVRPPAGRGRFWPAVERHETGRADLGPAPLLAVLAGPGAIVQRADH